MVAGSQCWAQNYTASVTPGSIQGPKETTGSTYYSAVSSVTITNNTSSAKGFFIVSEIAVSDGGGTVVVKSQITVNAKSTQTVTNQNGKTVPVGTAGDKKVNAKTKVTTDSNEDVSAEWVLFAPLAIFVMQGADVPPNDSYN